MIVWRGIIDTPRILSPSTYPTIYQSTSGFPASSTSPNHPGTGTSMTCNYWSRTNNLYGHPNTESSPTPRPLPADTKYDDRTDPSKAVPHATSQPPQHQRSRYNASAIRKREAKEKRPKQPRQPVLSTTTRAPRYGAGSRKTHLIFGMLACENPTRATGMLQRT